MFFNSFNFFSSSITAPSVRQNASANVAGDTHLNIDLTLPSSPVAGNLMVVCISSNVGVAIGPPAGWTTIGTNPGGGIGTMFYRVVVGGDGTTYSFYFDGQAKGDIAGGVIAEISGTPASPIDVSANSLSTNTGPTVTTTQINDMVLAGIAVTNTNNILIGPSGFTLIGTSYAGTPNNPDANAWIYYKIFPAGATGTYSITTVSSTADRIFTVAIKGV